MKRARSRSYYFFHVYMFHYLYCKAIYYRGKIAKKHFVNKLFETRVGVKYFFPVFDPIFNNSDSEVFMMDPNELYLEFDALLNKYTLCDTSLTSSPHLDFLRAISSGGNIKKTDYVRRCEQGTLDMRNPRYIGKEMLLFFKEKFNKRKEEVKNNNYKPVTVYKVGERYYIADGKHRAAMCALLGINVKCAIVDTPYLEDSFYHWIYEKMKKTPDRYKKNIEFFERFYSK